MASRRMIAKSVIHNDSFLLLPLSAQALYLQLCVDADDDGFMTNTRSVLRMIGASEEDLDLLVQHGYLIRFPSGAYVITHWHIHNRIRSDRKQKTLCQNELSQLLRLQNMKYTLRPTALADLPETEHIMPDNCPADVSQLPDICPHSIVEDRSDKERLDEDRQGEANLLLGSPDNAHSDNDDICHMVLDMYHDICTAYPYVPILTNKHRAAIKYALDMYTIEDLKQVFELVMESSYLAGSNRHGWIAQFDWIINTAHIAKILEGTYTDWHAKHQPADAKTFVLSTAEYDAIQHTLSRIKIFVFRNIILPNKFPIGLCQSKLNPVRSNCRIKFRNIPA